MSINEDNYSLSPYNIPPIAAYLILALFSVLIFSMYGLELPFHRDNALYLYSAQRLLEGEIPYQSVFDMKTPLTSFVTAFALFISEPVFDNPIKGMRVAYIIVAVATVLLTYKLARKFFGDKSGALLAPLMMIGFHGYILQAAIGARPKIILLFFFVTSLIFVIDKRWFLLGLFSTLCAFTWQPSGTLFLVALLYAVLQKRDDRIRALSKLIVGAAIPTLIIAAYFLFNGAFKEFIQGSFIVHIYTYRPDEKPLYNIFRMIFLGYPFSSLLIIVSLPTFFIHGVITTIKNENVNLADNPFLPFTIIIALLFVESSIDFQGYADFFVFLPFTSLGLIILYQWAIDVFKRWNLIRSDIHLRATNTLALVGICVIPFLNFFFSDIISNHTALWKGCLLEQKNAYLSIVTSALENYDAKRSRIIEIGLPEAAVLLGFKSQTQYGSAMNDMHGFDTFISTNYPDGFAGWLEEMKEKKPDLVIIKVSDIRAYSDENRALLTNWLKQNFREVSANEYIHSEKFRSKDIHTWARVE